MDKKYNDEEFDKFIRNALQQDSTDYDEVTAALKQRIDEEIERKNMQKRREGKE